MSRSLSILMTVAVLFMLSTSSESFSQQQVNENDSALMRVAVRKTFSNDHQQKVHSYKGKSIQKHEARARDLTAEATPARVHHVVIQVSQNDPTVMTIALNNAQNLTDYFQQKGESVQVEFVAYGPGLRMLRADTSPVSDRVKSFAEKNKNVTFSACGNTLNIQSKQENTEIMLLPEARIVPAGIARITELEEQGWTYVRP
jgi:uncharacterized protein